MPSISELPPSPFPLSAMPLVSSNALLHAHLKQEPPLRPSNRGPSEPRPIQLNTGSLTHCNGSSLVKIGATTIVCGVRAEILPVSEIPSFRVAKTSERGRSRSVRQAGDDEYEDENEHSPIQLYNLLVPNIELATGCSPFHPAGFAPSVEAQSLSQRILSLLHTSKLVRISDLEIVHTPPEESRDLGLGINADPELKAYWVLYIDMMCISHGGSLFDAAWMALHAALRDTLLPKAWWDVDAEQILCSSEVNVTRTLRLRGVPVPSSFGVFVPDAGFITKDEEDRYWVLMDMDGLEEETCEESGCITVDCSDGNDSMLRIERNGGVHIGVGQMEGIAGFAKKRWEQWKEVLEKSQPP
jgi:exosome complex component RRP43